MPVRVRIERTPEWTKPPDARDVTRLTRYGNPFRISPPVRDLTQLWQVIWTNQGAGRDRMPLAGFEAIWCKSKQHAHELAMRLFREWLTAPKQADLLEAFRHELAGLDLMCWCSLDLPCHADVLLDLVNRP
jgi:hypothetical protein